MQTPQERKRLIADGRFTELEPPNELEWGRRAPEAILQAFPGVAVVKEREAGEDG